MNIVMISGSNRRESENVALLMKLPPQFKGHVFQFVDISTFPLFTDQSDGIRYPKVIMDWRHTIEKADLVIICTPEYIHNIPAALKNALEWVTQSGELAYKKVLPITYTPTPPRGEKAMQSLLWSLKALDMNIVGQLDLYQRDDTSPELLYSVLEEIVIEK